ncbi:hypothetical protein QYE76_006264 [Lolium multiflorum]|uniref:Uncharacterized protein n=1 Tax=Lolium multiflorum TaxID=4521 RepID=A0AAD8RWG6_LOLMU|nr:hypothetical protein QYE76_006264 [Lolium multiflorum]
MAESSNANATVSGLKVILNRPKSPEHLTKTIPGDAVQPTRLKLGHLRGHHHAKTARCATIGFQESTVELEILRKELKDLEEKVRVTKELIYDKEASIARSQREAEGLKAELKTDLAEIRALNKQLVTGKDDDDKAEIAEVDHVRAGALRALETFLQ